jgi:ATP-dependent DNA helicase DinG
MRQRAAASDVVIVNHHLLCADAAVRKSAYGEVIPSCTRAVVDEAHQLEEVATQYFGSSVSTFRLEELARDVERLPARAEAGGLRARQELTRDVERLRDHARRFFADLTYAHRGDGRVRNEERLRATTDTLLHAADAASHLTSALDILQADLAPLAEPSDEHVDAESIAEQVQALIRRTGDMRDELRLLMRADDPDYVYFVEFRGRGIFLRASPIDVSSIMGEVLFDRMKTTVLTSATLSVDGTFEYVRDRLGIRRAEEIRLASEFDFNRQAILYLPPRMPDPRSDGFPIAAGRQVIELLQATKGRAFVLFTSYATMRAVQALTEMAVNFPILAQGTAPRSQLLNDFRNTPHAVLFATSSFWQGVDVIGEALSCVIIDKLPFASPADPVTAARIDAIRGRGGDPFGDYQVPLAILALQQGLGRLIRHRRDRGVLAILDPRLRTKPYGRRFLASLPPAPVVGDLARVAAFMSSDAPA